MLPQEVASLSFKLIETGDLNLAEQIIDKDFINHEAQDDPEDRDRQLKGPKGFLATSEWLKSSFSDLHFIEQENAVNNDVVMIATLMCGKHTGEFQHIQPTGGEFKQKQVHIFHIKNGKILSHRAVRDDLGLLFQLGWKPNQTEV